MADPVIVLAKETLIEQTGESLRAHGYDTS